MSLQLTAFGCLWSLLSLLAAGAVCTGYYLPYWLQGYLTYRENNEEKRFPAYFGSFRRCNYLTFERLHEGCGRYSEFTDIPSIWWQVCTVTVGIGCSFATVVALVSIPAWLTKGLITRNVGRLLGVIQAFSAILISVGCVLYPFGWNNKYVREVCGENAESYFLGSCEIGWAYYMMLGGAFLLFICASLSTVSGRRSE